MSNAEVVARAFPFPEGPRWHDGRLYFVDHMDGYVRMLGNGGRVEQIVKVRGGPSGMGWRPDGEHLIVSMADKRVVALHEGEVVKVAELAHLVAGPLNDMVVGGSGRAYVGCMGSNVTAGEPLRPTVLVKVEQDGTATVAADELVFPNGIVLTPDERTLIVAESMALRLTAFDVDARGELSRRRTWASFGEPPELDWAALPPGAPFADGIALDAEGAVWVADAAGPAVLRVAEGGEVLERVATGDLGSYSVALGGDDRRTLYICANTPIGRLAESTGAAGCLMSCRVDVPGAGWP